MIADAFPTPDDVAMVLVGDAEKIRDSVRQYGPLAEIALGHADTDGDANFTIALSAAHRLGATAVALAQAHAQRLDLTAYLFQ